MPPTLLELPLELALVAELEAAGVRGDAARDGLNAVLACIAGFLIMAWRRDENVPEPLRPAALWASVEPGRLAPETAAAMSRAGDLGRAVRRDDRRDRGGTSGRVDPAPDAPGGAGGGHEHERHDGGTAAAVSAPVGRPATRWLAEAGAALPDRTRAIAALLPPGLEPCGEPVVQLNVYCVPVHGEPEHGVSTKVPARFGDVEGSYCLGIGIDQESAIFVSQETNGQPKFPCQVKFFRVGDAVHASATHQGTTFMSYAGTPSGTVEPDGVEHTEHEWWIKASRAVGGGQGFDLAPTVVQVTTSGVRTHTETLGGELVRATATGTPHTTLLPMLGPASAELVTTRHTGRRSVSPARWTPTRSGRSPTRSAVPLAR